MNCFACVVFIVVECYENVECGWRCPVDRSCMVFQRMCVLFL